jgi:hypothetical protein
MIKFFDTCQVIDYCVPKPEAEPEPEPEPTESEWLMTDNPPKVFKRSWRPWSRRARSTVRAVPAVYPEHLTQEMKRDT